MSPGASLKVIHARQLAAEHFGVEFEGLPAFAFEDEICYEFHGPHSL